MSGYSTPGDADQKGTTRKLNTGDCRALDGFYLHGYIHFVHHKDAGSGYSGIGYVRVKVSNATSTESVYSAVGTADKCYPAITPLTNDSNDKSVLIGYNESSTSFYPQTSAVTCSDNMNFWSASTLVKAGVSFVSYGFGGSTDRWGDYNGICRKYNSNPPASWMAGMYGNSAKQWSQWIAKIRGVSNIGVPEVSTEEMDISVFPNPVYDNCSIKFNLKERTEVSMRLVDMQGKVVKDLYKGIAEQGENSFSFNKANLSTGTYFLHITGNANLIKNEKIIIGDK